MHTLVKKTYQFFRELESKDKIAVLHHSDTDGICSGVLAAKIVEKLRGKRIDVRMNTEPSRVTISHAHVKDLRKAGITKLICVDCCVDEDPETIKLVEEFAKILIVDHHKLYQDLNSKRTVLIKPVMLNKKEDGSEYCVSKFLFDISPVDISDLDWISVAGLIGDMNHKRWSKFVKAVHQKYNLKWNKDIYKTTLGRGSNFLNFAAILKELDAAFWKTYSANGPTELLKLTKEYAIVEKEINYWVDNREKFAELHPKQNLIFYELEPKYPIKSVLATLISNLHPKTTIITTEAKGGEVTISARRQDFKVKMNALLEKAVKGFEHSSAGGHIPAAGGHIQVRDLEKFKKRVIQLLSKELK